jgi:hypothetical protein
MLLQLDSSMFYASCIIFAGVTQHILSFILINVQPGLLSQINYKSFQVQWGSPLVYDHGSIVWPPSTEKWHKTRSAIHWFYISETILFQKRCTQQPRFKWDKNRFWERLLTKQFSNILFVFALCLVFPMLPVSLDCPFLFVPSIFSNVSVYSLSKFILDNLSDILMKYTVLVSKLSDFCQRPTDLRNHCIGCEWWRGCL